MPLPVSDGFVQTSGVTQVLTTYSAAWTILEGNFSVGSGNNAVHGTGAGYNTARHNVETFAADQYSQVTLTAGLITAGEYGGAAVRCQIGVNSSYHVEANGTNFYVSRCVAGVQTTLFGPISQAFAGGDVLRVEITGTGATVTIRVFRALAATPTVFSQVGTDYLDTSASRITSAGQGGIFKYGDEGTARITNFQAGNLAAGSPFEVTGNATLEDLSSSGTINGGSTLSGTAVLSDISSSGTIDAPNSLTGSALLGDLVASGTVSGGSGLSGTSVLGDITSSGSLGSGVPGTFTTPPLARLNEVLALNSPLSWLAFRVQATGASVIVLTGLSTNGSGVISVTNAALTPGVVYRAEWLEASGHYGHFVAEAT